MTEIVDDTAFGTRYMVINNRAQDTLLNPVAEPNEAVQFIAQFLSRYANQGSEKEGGIDFSRVAFEIDILGWHPQGTPCTVAGENKEPHITCPLRLLHSHILLGPVVDGHSPCATCLERRWTALRPLIERIALEDAEDGILVGRNPLVTPYALEILPGLVDTVLTRHRNMKGAPQPYGEVYVLSLETHQVKKHLLIKDSLCPSCARKLHDSKDNAEIKLISRPKKSPTSFRQQSLSDHSMAVNAFANPVCGMLGAHSYHQYSHCLTATVNGQYNIRGTRGDHPIWWAGHASSYARSQIAGLIEGIERHAGLLPRKKEITVFDSYNNLREQALNPVECGLYPESVYQINPFFTPFTSELKFSWVWGYSLTEEQPILVPEQLVYYTDFTRTEPTFVQDCSNGCATGSSLEEAILFALMELIERDSFLITWFAKLSLPKIVPSTCKTEETLFLLDRLERLGLDIYLMDMRLDLPIPSVLCVALRRDREPGTMVLAAGASLDPEQAVRGALCEVASYVSDFSRRVSENIDKVKEMALDYRKVESIHDHALLYGLPEMVDRANFLTASPHFRSMEETYHGWFETWPHSLDLREDIEFCLDRLRAVRLMRAVAIDQTSPEQERLGLRTARMIVPGLIPIDFGYGRDRFHTLARMKTVPRSAGFRSGDITEAEFNPLPHPFP